MINSLLPLHLNLTPEKSQLVGKMCNIDDAQYEMFKNIVFLDG